MTARVIPFGDRALLVEVDDVAAAHLLAAAVDRARARGRAPRSVTEVVVGMGNVVIHLDERTDGDDVHRWVESIATRPPPTPPGAGPARGPVHLPVVFDGPDLEEVAGLTGHTGDQVVALLTGARLTVAFLGFAPGFPYLTGLPPVLAAVPRRSTPRTAVPAGSVAVGGGFASVYPRSTPGGWRLLGRTATPMFDPDHPPFALLRPGDGVRFSVADASGGPDAGAAPAASPRAPREPLAARGPRFVEVLDPGLLSLVEDAGRRGVASMGVPGAGPADADTFRLANRLAGNPDGAAAIEVTASGPRLRFTGPAHLAVVTPPGGHLRVEVDGHPVGTGSVIPVADGQEVVVGRLRGALRAYLAVAGGLGTPPVLGSRSTDLLSGVGPGPLRAGDRLDLGPPTRPHGLLDAPVGPARSDPPRVIRIIEGPHRLAPGAGVRSMVGPWTVDPASDRIGVRLRPGVGTAVPVAERIPSTGMVTGAIQLPPDGHPIILGPDHATVGGYPVVGCVISADLPVVGQLGPGDTVALATVDRAEARAARRQADRTLAARVSGWFPTRAAL